MDLTSLCIHKNCCSYWIQQALVLLVDPASQPVPSLDQASAGPSVDAASADPLSGPTTRGGGDLHTWEYLGCAAGQSAFSELPALAQGIFFEHPELGQGAFLRFQLWAPA